MRNWTMIGEVREMFSDEFSDILKKILRDGSSKARLKDMKNELLLLIDVVDFLDKRIDEMKEERYHDTPDHTTIGDLMK